MPVTSNVSTFLQTIGQGVRPNLFLATFNIPKIVSDSYKNIPFNGAGTTGNTGTGLTQSDTINVLCKSAALPSSNLGVIDVPFRGRTVKVVGDRTFDTWTATFFNDTDFLVRNTMERWLSAMNTHEANTADLWTPVLPGTNAANQVSPAGYTADITIQQLQRDAALGGDALRTYTLFSCFPTNVSQIDLAYDSNDQIEDFTVEFQVQYWQANAAGTIGTGITPHGTPSIA